MASTSFCHAHTLQAVSLRERFASGCSFPPSTASLPAFRTSGEQPVGLSCVLPNKTSPRMAHKAGVLSAQVVQRTAGTIQARADDLENTSEALPAFPAATVFGSWGLGLLLSAAALGFSIPTANAEIVSASMMLMPGTTGIGGPASDEPKSREKEFIVTFQKTTPTSVVDAICYEAALGDLGSTFSGECVETKFTDRGNFLLINTTDEDMETLMEVHSTHIASVVLNQPVWLDEATEVFCGPFYGTECKTQGYL